MKHPRACGGRTLRIVNILHLRPTHMSQTEL